MGSLAAAVLAAGLLYVLVFRDRWETNNRAYIETLISDAQSLSQQKKWEAARSKYAEVFAFLGDRSIRDDSLRAKIAAARTGSEDTEKAIVAEADRARAQAAAEASRQRREEARIQAEREAQALRARQEAEREAQALRARQEAERLQQEQARARAQQEAERKATREKDNGPFAIVKDRDEYQAAWLRWAILQEAKVNAENDLERLKQLSDDAVANGNENLVNRIQPDLNKLFSQRLELGKILIAELERHQKLIEKDATAYMNAGGATMNDETIPSSLRQLIGQKLRNMVKEMVNQPKG